MGGGDRHIDNGVFIRFGFDDFEVLENFQTNVKNKATEDARRVCLYTPLEYCVANSVFALWGAYMYNKVLLSYRREVRSCSF